MLLSNRSAAWIAALVLAQPIHDSKADIDAGIAAYRRGDFAAAFAEFNAAAKQNDPLALNVLGIMYAEGVSVERNDRLAVDWFFKAQALGSLEAAANLGRMYAEGRGVTQSNAEAVRLYRDAALGGYLPAMKRLAEVYERGELGVTADPALALEWRTRLRGTPTGLMYPRPAHLAALPPTDKPPVRKSERSTAPPTSAPKSPGPTSRDTPTRADVDKKFEKRVMEQLEKYRHRERKLQVASTDTTPALATYLKNLRIQLRNRLEDVFTASAPSTALTVSVSIRRDGSVKDVELDHGSGNPRLDRKVLLALKQLGRFAALPAPVNETVDILAVTVRLPIE